MGVLVPRAHVYLVERLYPTLNKYHRKKNVATCNRCGRDFKTLSSVACAVVDGDEASAEVVAANAGVDLNREPPDLSTAGLVVAAGLVFACIPFKEGKCIIGGDFDPLENACRDPLDCEAPNFCVVVER